MYITQLLEISGINYDGIVILLFFLIIIININAFQWLLGCYLHLHPSQKKQTNISWSKPNTVHILPL